MPILVKFLLTFLSNRIIQNVIVEGLSGAAKRSDNTVDDTVVDVVRRGLGNQPNPINRAVGK